MKAILEPITKKQPTQAFYRRTVYFIEKLTRGTQTIQSIEDREKLAEDLDLALVELFVSEGHRRNVFTRLFNFLRQFIESYRASSSLSVSESEGKHNETMARADGPEETGTRLSMDRSGGRGKEHPIVETC